MDHEELENLKFPVTVMIIETLDGDATDADLYNAGYNMFEMEIHSLNDIPKGYEIHGIVYDEDADGGEEE
jgi:hypothetical protein